MYNINYYENTLRLNSQTAEDICKIRWDFIEQIHAKTVLDYGSGVGWFRAYRPEHVEVDSFDIGPAPQTGICLEKYDVICLWDVLEHLSNFQDISLLLMTCRYAALTVPCLPEGQDISSWKHYKPLEHLHVFTQARVEILFKGFDFHLIKQETPECPPREDITSFLFKANHEG